MGKITYPLGYNKLQFPSTLRWLDKHGNRYYLYEMDDKYILNVYNCLIGKGNSIIPEVWAGILRSSWEEYFLQELQLRGLSPKHTNDLYPIY